MQGHPQRVSSILNSEGTGDSTRVKGRILNVGGSSGQQEELPIVLHIGKTHTLHFAAREG